MLRAIFATDQKRGFGYKGRLPWPRIREDMKLFREITSTGAVVMGKATYMSLPFPLPHRIHVVVSDSEIENEEIIKIPRNQMQHIKKFGAFARYSRGKDVTIIGGTSLLIPEHLQHCEEIYHTEVKGVFEADTFISEEVFEYLNTLEHTVHLETNKIITRKYETIHRPMPESD